MSGGTKNNVLITKPSERFQDTRVILIFLVKFEKRRVKTLRQEASLERRRDRGVTRILLSDIYNPKTQFFYSRLNNASDSIKQGAPKVGEGSDYQLVTPTMRLYLPRDKARLRGITAL